jgi:hypothetical protein
MKATDWPSCVMKSLVQLLYVVCGGAAPTSTSMMVPQPIMTSPSYLQTESKRIRGMGEGRL